MQMRVTSLRLPAELLARLKRLAHERSLAEGRDVSWSRLAREAVERLLREHEQEGA